jgi:hypothetical protein
MRKMVTGEGNKIYVLKYDNELAENTNKLNSSVIKM